MFVDKVNDIKFWNVSQRVGTTGIYEDFMLVQMLLKIIYTEGDTFLKKPIKGEISVTGRPAPDTPVLIAHYQKHVMHRAKPEGYVNKAVGSDKHKFSFTIVSMNRIAAGALTGDTDDFDGLNALLQKILRGAMPAMPTMEDAATDTMATVRRSLDIFPF